MKTLITKLILETITEDELIVLHDWIKNPKNKAALESYILDYHDLNLAVLETNFDVAYNKIIKHIDEQEKTNRTIFPKWALYGIAASIILFISINIFFNKAEVPIIETQIVNEHKIEIGTDKATLTLDDGTNILLEKGGEYLAPNLSSNGEELIYSAPTESISEITYNFLTIPRGGQYFIKLSDGTKVWLNSESKLKFPVTFIKGETRQVELIYGEAYFEVTASTLNDGARFKVISQGQDVEVLGTEFNIKAYKEESSIFTTLVKGKVTINLDGKTESLSPNQQSVLETNTNSLTIATVDVYNSISWKEGVFSFDGLSLKKIMQVLSRWYDIDVVFADKTLESQEFVGVLSKNQKIEDILLTIKNFGIIKEFTIADKTIILK